MNITLDDLRGVPQEDIVNPNIPRKANPENVNKGSVKEVNPAEILGLKSQRELDRENPDLIPPEEQVFGKADEAINKKIEEVRQMQELYDQTEGDVTVDDLNDIIGFDPIEMMKNPPRPGKISARETLQLSEEEKRKILGAQEAVNTAKENKIKYENDEVDEDELLEREIMEGIPEEDDEYVTTNNVAGHEYQLNTEDITPVNRMEENEVLEEPINKSNVIEQIPEEKVYKDRSEDDDLKALEDDYVEDKSSEEALNEERLKLLKEDAKAKVKAVSFGNLTGFTISKKPISVGNTVRLSEMKNSRVADWVLPSTGRVISMREFKGTEIEQLLASPGRNKINTIKQQYQLIFDHIVDPYKPIDMEAWTKLISVADVDHLYAAVYRACFEGKNFIPYDCPDDKVCKNSFLTDSIPFMEMVKFKDSDTKRRFDSILNSTPTAAYRTYDTDILPVSDVYALGFREPSIYDVVFVSAYLDDEFVNKYRDIMSIAPYIDGLYYIDQDNMTLRPIDVKNFPNDKVKSEKAKIITLSKIVKELTSDQYNMLVSYANNTIKNNDDITFIMPEIHCPKCGRKIEETTYTASQLLFLRHRLTALVNG